MHYKFLETIVKNREMRSVYFELRANGETDRGEGLFYNVHW